jgi:nucleoside-diphosphate-sugar epimerase
VAWRAADALNPATYKAHIESCTGVIFGIGALMEGPYKRWMGKERDGAAAQSLGEVNRDSALSAARALAESGRGRPFVFISASSVAPIMSEWSPAYLETKREAEVLLQERADAGDIRLTVLRPGLIFSEREPLTLGAAALFQAFTPETVELEPPLHVETVARAALHASLDEETSGVLDVAAIRALAARSAASC